MERETTQHKKRRRDILKIKNS